MSECDYDMLELQEIINLTPTQAEQIHKKALEGDADSVRYYVFYSAWRGIDLNKMVAESDKKEIYENLIKIVNVELVKSNG